MDSKDQNLDLTRTKRIPFLSISIHFRLLGSNEFNSLSIYFLHFE